MEPAIRAHGLAKRYRLGGQRERYRSLRESLMAVPKTLLRRRAGPPIHWALRDVNFEVQPGEVVGIIGRNGAGKSTLLKILSRITEPTLGRAEIRGRAGSLLEVGTGFHPELTGRENIYLNGAILGMKKAEIQRQFDAIVSFAEVEPFLDTPVKRYSSGMSVRLAFAVAAHLDTEILVVDEVLAVGDTAFQKKCMGRMREVGRAGRTVLFVSHNMGAVAELCQRGIVLEKGRVVSDCGVGEALETYAQLIQGAGEGATAAFPDNPDLPCAILEVTVGNARGEKMTTFDLADEIVVSMKYVIRQKMHDLSFDVQLSRNMTDLFHSYDTDAEEDIAPKEPGVYVARHRLPSRFLKAGSYTVTVGSGTPHVCYQVFSDLLPFEILELSEATQLRGYRRDRAGHIISPGVWETERLSDVLEEVQVGV
ncbi:MAG TPA: polysaccharide ABC transporter ATP-binding protein [Chloroflexota bacterium]|nr:polysaccharide ABC transporter ATP-binding protein [Chloroflexota bacterium]